MPIKPIVSPPVKVVMPIVTTQPLIKRIIPIKPIVSPPVKVNDRLTQEYQSTDAGITVNGIWYPDQPPIGYNEQLINTKPMIPQIIDSAPPQEIYGQVIDEDRQPIPYVEVYTEQRTTNGTTTDNNGNYRLTVLGFENVVFSYAGYSQSFSAMGVPRILQLKANDLATVDLGNVPTNTPATASFGKIAALLLGGLFLGSLFKTSENKPTTKAKPIGLNKPHIRKKVKTITL